MARKKEKSEEEKTAYREEKQSRLLERLGFVQLMFDFYSAPVI
jgi:hypothetical protein